MNDAYDVFFSYRRKDLDRVQPLLNALKAAAVRVWRDQKDLPDNASITREIRRALAASKTLVAFHSSKYPLSRPCQQEIIAAWLAAQERGDLPYERVLVINPEENFDHLPQIFREQQSMHWAPDASGFAALAGEIRDHVNRLAGTLAGAGSPITPTYYGMVSVEAARFVGRVRELWDLHGQLTANRMSIVSGVFGQAVTQVRGLGGNGKTLLAREYAIRFGSAYPGGVFWLNAYSNETTGALDPGAREDQIAHFAERIGIPTTGLKPTELESALWRRLETNGQPCLWIVDDLPPGLDPEDIQRRWIAGWRGASTLIITRSMEYAVLGDHLDLDVLSEGEAQQLLTSRRTPRDKGEQKATQEVVQELGYHPLAVELAGSYLAKGIQSFSEYAADLRNPDQDAAEFGSTLRESLPTGHERSISGTLLKSIRRLGDEGMDFLRLASVLAAAPVPVSLVKSAFAQLDPPVGPKRVLDALDQADSLGLCSPSGDDARTVHPLVSRTIRYHAKKEDRTTLLRSAVTSALSEILEVVDDVRQHSRVNREVVHARHVISGDISSRAEATVAGWIARHDYERGDYAGARKLQERMLDTALRSLGDDHPDTLRAMHDLAWTLTQQGELAPARQLQEQVLAGRRRLLGEEHPHTLLAKNNLALIMSTQGDLAGARRLLEQGLEASRRLLGDEHPHTLTTLSNLAQTLFELGALTQAEELQRPLLEASERLWGDDHPNTLGAKNNLSQTLEAQGNLAEARRLYEQVLEARRRLLGDEHPATLASMNNLAQTVFLQEDLAGARTLQEQVLSLSRRLIGEEHPHTLRTINNLAWTMKAQGDLTGARELQEQALEASRRSLGPMHPDTTVIAWNLALTLLKSGETNEVQNLLMRDLLWLLERDPATLPGNLQKIRQAMVDIGGGS